MVASITNSAAFDPRTAQRIAHDDEGRRKNQERHGGEGLRRRALLQQSEPAGRCASA